MKNQSCKVCNKRQYFDFRVCDEIWDKIVPKKYRKLAMCLPCFDKFAKRKNVDYEKHLYPIMTFVGDKVTLTLHISDRDDLWWLCNWTKQFKKANLAKVVNEADEKIIKKNKVYNKR